MSAAAHARSTGAVATAAEPRLRIVAFTYACLPGEGSEPGAGWLWSRMLAQVAEVWVITHESNRGPIEKDLSELPERDHLHFVYVDLPRHLRYWKGDQAIRAHYLLWQFAALKEVRRLARTIRFDLSWHVTFANAWLGSTLPLAGLPFVYGPVGGGLRPPLRLVRFLGFRGLTYEAVRTFAQAFGRYVNPLARVAWSRADLILSQNPETRDWLPRAHRARMRVFPHAVLEYTPERAGSRPGRTAIFAARLIPWKGGALALRAMAELPGWTLLVCGAGPDERRLRRLAGRLQLGDRVRFLGLVPHGEVLRLMANEASVLLHPSLHDDAPFVVAEAVCLGLPVVCLDRGGPPIIAREAAIAVPPRGDVVGSLARALGEAAVSETVARKDWLFEQRTPEVVALLRSVWVQAREARVS
jgi:glycosyltransferase involved in cell wall biosynthesis